MRDIAGVDESGNQLPLTDEVYTQVFPPKQRRRVQLMGPSFNSHAYELENELAEMKRVAQEKEEERRREIDEMKIQFQTECEEMESRLLQKLLNNVPVSSLLNSSL